MTPQFLAQFFVGHTYAQAQRSVAGYLGNWIRFEASVRDVHVLQTTTVVSLHVDTGGDNPFTLPYRVALWFTGKWAESVGLLNLGDEISVMGRITDIRQSEIELHDCELAEKG